MTYSRVTETDHIDVLQAFDRLKLHTENGHQEFVRGFSQYCAELGLTRPRDYLAGLSLSNIKLMHRKQKAPDALPVEIVSFLFIQTQIDVSYQKALISFGQLDFSLQLSLDAETLNSQNANVDVHELKNLSLEIQEAKAIAEDPNGDDFELDLRIGFDCVRLSIVADGMKTVGNRIVGETPLNPQEPLEPEYSGWFNMRLVSRHPLSWVFDPIQDGEILKGRLKADALARIEVNHGSDLIAEISAKREALKVRVIAPGTVTAAPKSVTDQHRNRMCAILANKHISGNSVEWILHRQPLYLLTSTSNFTQEN